MVVFHLRTGRNRAVFGVIASTKTGLWETHRWPREPGPTHWLYGVAAKINRVRALAITRHKPDSMY